MDPRLELIQYYRWLRQYGLNDSHSGNLSVRCGDDYWITPSGACADTVQADDLIRCRMDDNPAPNASLDAPLHRLVYRKNPDASVVMHSHGAHSVAMTLGGNDFTPVDFEGQFYFKHVPVLNIAYADYLDKAPAMVAEALAKHPLTVVRGHGVYVAADTMNLAYKWTCSLELSARTAWLAAQAGQTPPPG